MRYVTLIATAFAVLALAITSVAKLPTKLLWNGSESAPTGLYWIDDRTAERGDYVLVDVPKSMRNSIIERGYLPPEIPLIKRIVATKGDTVCRRNFEIVIDGVSVALAQKEDRLGRKLPVWSGCYVLDGGQVFLLQNHPDSLDSRYFGHVNRSLITGRATLLRWPWQTGRKD